VIDADPDLDQHALLREELALLFTEQDEGFLTKS